MSGTDRGPGKPARRGKTPEDKGNLIITLRDGCVVRIGPDIEIHVRRLGEEGVKMKICAPKSLVISREETTPRDFYMCLYHHAKWARDISPRKQFEVTSASSGRKCIWCKKPQKAVVHIHIAPGVRSPQGGEAREALT